MNTLQTAGAAMDSADALKELIARQAVEIELYRKDAERYRVLRNADYQLDEDDVSVSDSFFNVYFGEELDAAVDALQNRHAAIQKETP
jgi:hypothetical protein